ncbi:MAG: beta-propeller fold lactonase family protein [Gemmatimonadales bacterium]|nr:beta-propeller fold lactonase family protein [Gemmatimonadales bacterium]
MTHRMTALAVTALALAACTDTRETTAPTADLASSSASSPGAVYAMTNDATNNEVVVLNRSADGILTSAGSFPTGGLGSGTFENSANGLILGEQSPNNLNGSHKYLYATNAGSDNITVFRTTNGGLEITDVEPSGGDHPLSVTVHDNTLYVMNGGASNCSGGAPSITGFRVSPRGELTPIPGSTRPISGGANSGCAQISFTKNGDVLVVTQRQADKIDTYLVDKSTGIATGPIVNETTGVGPFGFSFTQRGQLLTTENFGAAPLQGGAASYEVPSNGVLVPLGPTERNGRSDTCWLVNTDNGRYAYTTNFQSGDISSFRVEPDGTLILLNPIAAVIGVGASDEALSGNSRFLYARNALQGTISVFEVENDGSLTRLQDILALPPGGAAIGIAAK